MIQPDLNVKIGGMFYFILLLICTNTLFSMDNPCATNLKGQSLPQPVVEQIIHEIEKLKLQEIVVHKEKQKKIFFDRTTFPGTEEQESALDLLYALVKQKTKLIQTPPQAQASIYKINLPENNLSITAIFLVLDLTKPKTNITKWLAKKSSKKSLLEFDGLPLCFRKKQYSVSVEEGNFYSNKNFTQLLASKDTDPQAYPITSFLLLLKPDHSFES